MREVEKEVVLLDTQTSSTPTEDLPSTSNANDIAVDPALLSMEQNDAMEVDSSNPQPSRESSATVLKLIKKIEVQVLCPQHNPVCLLLPKPG